MEAHLPPEALELIQKATALYSCGFPPRLTGKTITAQTIQCAHTRTHTHTYMHSQTHIKETVQTSHYQSAAGVYGLFSRLILFPLFTQRDCRPNHTHTPLILFVYVRIGETGNLFCERHANLHSKSS